MPAALLLAVALLSLRPASAAAQSLRGRVLDASNQGPVGGATVRLLSLDSAQVAGVLADEAGLFVVPAPGAAEYLVAVDRFGYTPNVSGPVRLRAGGFATVTITLAPRPIPLDSVGVRVPAQDPNLRLSGFYNRKQDGAGIFLERADIEKKSTGRMSDALGGLSGVRVLTDNGTDVQLRGSMTNVLRGTPQMCLPLVYMDGLLVADGKTAGYGRMNLEQIRPQDVAGIEIYMGESSVPLQFARGGGACGAILFWTRAR
jgi:hypothetical protein